jgi:hypothetical protein
MQQGTDPLAVVSLIIAGASLLISGIVAYRGEFRGADMHIDLLRAPVRWQVSAGKPATTKAPGIWHVADVQHDDFTLMVTGKCPGRVLNSGPKGGGVWDLNVSIDPLDPQWSIGSTVDLSNPFTLDAKGSEGFTLTVVLSCPRDELVAAVKSLENVTQPLGMRLAYTRFRAFGRKGTEHSDVAVNAQEILLPIRSWAKESRFSLETGKPEPSES